MLIDSSSTAVIPLLAFSVSCQAEVILSKLITIKKNALEACTSALHPLLANQLPHETKCVIAFHSVGLIKEVFFHQ